ncbi:hypothetical protein ACO0LG_08620 [Undibacterium sp. Ji42W]|uniref:hypothetical protein n=1 Tax=Undibacterium sp. Ji42W TaxID=3413039 RepID=UPI003BF0F7D4
MFTPVRTTVSSFIKKAKHVTHRIIAVALGYKVEILAHGYIHGAVSYQDALSWAACYGIEWGRVRITRYGKTIAMRG